MQSRRRVRELALMFIQTEMLRIGNVKHYLTSLRQLLSRNLVTTDVASDSLSIMVAQLVSRGKPSGVLPLVLGRDTFQRLPLMNQLFRLTIRNG